MSFILSRIDNKFSSLLLIQTVLLSLHLYSLAFELENSLFIQDFPQKHGRTKL